MVDCKNDKCIDFETFQKELIKQLSCALEISEEKFLKPFNRYININCAQCGEEFKLYEKNYSHGFSLCVKCAFELAV